MMSICRKLLVTGLALPLLMAGATSHAEADPFAFEKVTREAKPWTRWWWLGSAVDDENLTTSMEAFAAAGLGGVEITPIYGIKGQEHRHIDYLTQNWLDRLAHTALEAERLDMGVDMPTGTGWPFGGPSVALEDADMKVTIVEASFGEDGALELPEGAVLLSLMHYGEDGSRVDEAPTLDEGSLVERAKTGTYYAVYYRFSGRMVKRPAPGGAGYSVNTYSEGAMAAYLDHIAQAMKGYSGPPLRAWFHDSFEYSGNWAIQLWEGFETRMGYDLRRYLPEMMGHGDPDTIARVKSDYRAVLADLLLNAFTMQWTEWSHAQGTKTRNQAHGSPGNLIDLYGVVDIPETEIFGPSGFPIPGLRTDDYFDNEPPDLLMLKFASSAAHLTGKRLVSSETCTWLGEHFQVALSQAKPEVDQLFAAGINHIFYHGTAYSPTDAAWPGWLFYASVHFGPTNTWWDDFQYLNGYAGRCQALLQSTAPANDILLYFPLHDIWYDSEGLQKQLTVHNIDDWLIDTPFYEAASMLTDEGYAFDYVSDAFLEKALVENGLIRLGESGYKTVVIPETPMMSTKTLARLFELAEAGATIVFLGEVPSDVPGFYDLVARRAMMAALQEGWERAQEASGAGPVVTLGKGRVLEATPLRAGLDAVPVIPEALATSGLSMIRQQHTDGYLYFVANLGATAIDDFWPLATKAQSVVWLDPLAERSGLAATKRGDEGATAVRIALKPGQSAFLRTYTTETISGPRWPYWQGAGAAIPLEGTWHVDFTQGGPVLPETFETEPLLLWTEREDAEAKRFGGTARYTLTFDGPANSAKQWRLDLGTVYESARVTLNGMMVGASWSLPHELLLEEPLKAQGNVLEIEVTNLAANRIADMDRRKVEWKIFHDTNIVNIRYKPFDASEWPLRPSGLLGPVTLTPLE